MASNDFKNSLKLLLTNIKDKHYTKEETNVKLQEIVDNMPQSDAIVDVEELSTENVNENVLYRVEEKSGWVGTPVPNTGYVENVYFNTNLSVEEVVNIIESANLDYSFQDMISFVLSDETTNKSINVFNVNGVYVIMFGEGNFVFASGDLSSSLGISFIGWNTDFNGVYEFNNNAISNFEMEGSIIPIGSENDKLSSLFSITPFVQATGKPQLYHFKDRVPYQLQEKVDFSHMVGQETIASESGWNGTIVPNSGIVENIYFNTELSNEEILSLLQSIDYPSFNVLGYNEKCYTVIGNEIDDITKLVFCAQLGDIFGIFVNSLTEPVWLSEEVPDFGFNFSGWKNGFDGIFNFSMIAIDGVTGGEWIFGEIGNQNSQLSTLFSTIPFVQAEGSKTTTLYQLKADGTLDKEKPINILSKEDVIDIINEQFENAEEGAY